MSLLLIVRQLHEVIKVSYRDYPVSVVCVSSVVNIYVVHPPLEATVLIQSLLNFTRMFDVMITRSSLNMGKVRLQTRSPG